MRLTCLALLLSFVATLASALEIEDHRLFPGTGDRMLKVISTADLEVFEPYLRTFQASQPSLSIDYTVVSSTELHRAIRAGDVPGYLEANHAFHFCLYDASAAPVLVDMARSMWLRFGPALRVVCARFGRSALPDRHLEALSAMRAGDAAALRLAIERDIAQGVDQVRAALDQGEI